MQLVKLFKKRLALSPFQPRSSTFQPEDSDVFTAAYKEDRHDFFDIVPGKEFKDSDRIRMVEYALRHARFGPGREEIGITKETLALFDNWLLN